jgi:hypothetical protein
MDSAEEDKSSSDDNQSEYSSSSCSEPSSSCSDWAEETQAPRRRQKTRETTVIVHPPRVQEPVAESTGGCPHTRHCVGCQLLPGNVFLLPNELALHGCCGNATAHCKADPGNHPVPQFDHLGLLITNSAGRGTPEARRKWIFQVWFFVSQRAGWLSPIYYINNNNKKRHRYSCCVHRRVRATIPSPFFLGFQVN